MFFQKASLAKDYAAECILDSTNYELPIIQISSAIQSETKNVIVKVGLGAINIVSPFKILQISGKGTGMIANKKIYPGDIILAEKPLILVPNAVFNDNQRIEPFLDKAVNKMSTIDREKFFDLSDCQFLDQSYSGTFFTNTMAYDDDFALMPLMARANHSCRPNSEFTTRIDLGVQHLVAMHVIEAGEEICINYMPAMGEGTDGRKIRQKYLSTHYGFQCICPICCLEGDELELNEAEREEVMELQAVGLDNLSLEDLDNLLEKCHGLGCKLSYILDIIQQLYSRYKGKDLANMVKYGVKGCLIANIVYGDGSIQLDAWNKRVNFREKQD